MDVNKRGFYSPWGYQEENDYTSSKTALDIKLEQLFSSSKYNKDDKKIHFFNLDGEELSGSSIDTSEFANSVIESTSYDSTTKILTIIFSNGDIVEINLAELIDEHEFSDGLQVKDGIVSIKIKQGDEYLSVDSDGLSSEALKPIIEGLQTMIEDEISRAEEAEQALDEKIDEEISRAETAEQTLNEKIDSETNRAENAEQALDEKIDAEETRAKEEETALNTRVDRLNDALDAEKSIREASDVAIGTRITNTENSLDAKIEQEKERAEAAESAINDLINDLSGETVGIVDELIEKLGYKDNDTLVTSNQHEVAFGEWNISNAGEETSGQTIFSIGNGTSENNRSNALEIRKDGSMYLLIEGEMMNVNDLLSQIAHETY